MASTDPRVDAYIPAAADFAQPILERLRRAVHRVRKAAALNADPARRTIKREPKPKPAAKPSVEPLEALQDSPSARAHFEAMPPGAQRKYFDWINEAKRAETRARRMAQALEWIGEGKRRNWKYERC